MNKPVSKWATVCALALLPPAAWASDYSGFGFLIFLFCAGIGGVVAGIEWMLVNAVMDRGEKAGPDDPEAQNKSRFGCSLGIALWAANSLIVWVVLQYVW